MVSRFIAVALFLMSALLPGLAFAQSQQTVFAAASLTDAIRQVNDLWVGKGNAPFGFSFAASSTLVRQIEQGADASIFISADERWMDWAQERNLIVAETRVSPIGNRLVLVAPKDSTLNVELTKTTDLAALLGEGNRLATGDPQHVPAGRYAQLALTWHGQWEAISPRLARADNVRSALLLVERGEAPLGIVYETDAAVSKGVRIVGVFPKESHEPVTYPFAVVTKADGPETRRLLGFLTGPEAQEVYGRLGFTKP
ncbi:molybdate ABC transporter substrate-binding protein [Pseudochelatococcus lubricantis]|uniref:molybdate ABC transporter substrate-binding protein n=1 Tax=Pseudochelatococcus lubricantis TaxID=1538102 RepID=UPI0035E8ADB8